MKRYLHIALIALALGALVPSPGSSQLWFYPDYALPTAGEDGSTWFSGGYGRGLNDASGKLDTFVGLIGHANDRSSFQLSYGYIDSEGDSESTIAGTIAVDLNPDNDLRFAFQGGAGWMSIEDATFFRFPLGVSAKQTLGSSSLAWTPWVMPKANIAYANGGGEDSTEIDLGASAGVYLTTASGFGVHTALDALFVDGGPVYQFGLGVNYWLGSR